ncbi:unnamed protein product [Acanthoscelides obtectus]|uniref:HTH CENPB-type domain-containing protein n=1 Tax=Acanthoscelides obtectus TaxID=200917 RepID=A0A9P0KNC0_ACAOB|nr:unnamed protein product [Acanthoscelides obtectus]CAK1642548.1 hypothetical protein AOBTE_LOCUS13111 [Acanthoscelides obtectus]
MKKLKQNLPILIFEERMFGMGIRDVRKLAFELATRNNLKHNFNTDKRMAGKKWYYGFMSRHKEISLRQPEKTSMARAAGFSKARVDKFYELLKTICEEDKFTAYSTSMRQVAQPYNGNVRKY